MGEGRFYVATTGNGYEPLAMLETLCISATEDHTDDQIYIPKLTSFGSIEISAKLSKEVLNKLFGICNSIFDCCPNKKVVHLAKHARKRKTRNKNYSRCIKIWETEAKKRRRKK